MQLVFIALLIGVLAFLVLNALITQSVWVRGARSGVVNFGHLAHKRDRYEEPGSYWGFLGFYVLALIWLVYLVFARGI